MLHACDKVTHALANASNSPEYCSRTITSLFTAHLQLDDVGMECAEAVIEQFPGHNAGDVRLTLNEFYGHLFSCL